MKKYLFAGAAVIATAAQLALAQPAPLADDRSVSVADMRQRSAERFSAMDANKDGQLTQEELRAGRGDGSGERFRRGRGMRRGGPGGAGPIFQGADANRDGAVTEQEFAAQALDHFRRLDANKDAKVTTEEVQAMRGQFGGRFGPGRGGRLAMLDADRNGSVSRAEFDRRLSDRIARLDADKDGTITAEERRAGRGARGMRP